MVFLAEHPQRRRVQEAALADALHDAYPDGPPPDVAAWLAERRDTPAEHRRSHGYLNPGGIPLALPFQTTRRPSECCPPALINRGPSTPRRLSRTIGSVPAPVSER